MTVPADDDCARAGEAQFRANHVHDSLAVGFYAVEANAEVVGVLLERLHLPARDLVLDKPAVDRRNVVVDSGDGQVRPAH